MSVLGTRYSDTAGLPFDASDLEARLAWIWGSPRSGSTWLLEQLCHPLEPTVSASAGFRVANQSGEAVQSFDAVPVDESFISNHLAPAFGDPVEIDGRYVPATLNNYARGKPSYAFSTAFEDVWRPEFRRLLLVRLQSIVERARKEGVPIVGHPLIVIKEVNGAHASDLVMSLIPYSRMIFLVRDGRDVVDSLLSAYAPGGFFARVSGRAVQTAGERQKALLWACRLWACNADVTLKAYGCHPEARRYMIKYEDLRWDPERTIIPLFDWLGLSRDDEWVASTVAEHSFSSVPASKRGAGRRARAAQPGLWRENLSEDEQRTAMEIMGPRLARLGYEA
jgi:Sulfotransferase family